MKTTKTNKRRMCVRQWLRALLVRWLRRRRSRGSDITLNDLLFWDMMDDD